MKKKCIVAWITALIIGAMAGCDGMDNYSVSPNHFLAFSADTVSFDTVFTTVGSTTNYFMIYNRNDEALKIERIVLAGGRQSNFRINVDGRKGASFNDIPIWPKDSLFVAVEVTVDPNDKDLPFVLYDSVVFVTNGVVQSVLLEAYGQNANILRGGVNFERDTTLAAIRPYLVYDSVMVAEGATVRVEKGASFYMHKGAKWLIDGTLKVDGTREQPVTFRGDRLNNFSTTISYDRVSAQWDGLFFGASSFDNEFNYALIRNGISGLHFVESTPDRKKADIRQSQITNMESDALWAANCHIEASGAEFSNAGRFLLMLAGGKYQFTHCTMANYMPSAMINGSGARFIASLTLADTVVGKISDNKIIYPLQQAYFDNCIIDGNMPADTLQKYSGEMAFSTNENYLDGHDEYFNYRFNHCVLKTKKITSERFVETLFVESPKYLKSNVRNDEDKLDYIFDFRLAEKSVGIGQADRSAAEQYPVDRYGVDRLTSVNAPSIGAYEYVPQEKPQ